jgi:hypothetical protein
MQTTIENVKPLSGAMDDNETPFGPVLFSYTRAQALADGFQIDVTSAAREAGIKFPVYLTRAVFDSFVAVPAGVNGQDETGRLWDVVWMLRHGIKTGAGGPIIKFVVFVRNDNRRARAVTLKAVCGPLEINDPAPAITVMLTSED